MRIVFFIHRAKKRELSYAIICCCRIYRRKEENVYGIDGDYYKAKKKDLQGYLDRKEKDKKLGYYSVICEIEQKWALTPYAKQSLLISTKDSNNNNLGMVIAGEGDNGATQAYLRFLKKLHNNGLHIEQAYALLTEKNDKARILGNRIAEFCDHETVRQYFDLLMYLKEQGISTRQLFNLLSIKSDVKWHNGHVIAVNQKPQTITIFLTLLTSFLNDGITAEEIFDYLSTKTDTQSTLGHAIARHQDASTIMQYFHLLDTLKQLGVDQNNIINLLNAKNTYNCNIYDYMATSLKNNELYQFICNNIFVGMQDKFQLGKQKEKIFDYINTLPLNEKKEALQNALTPSHPLHDFFSIQRGAYGTKLDRGMFAKIKIELDNCNRILLANDISNSINNAVAKNVAAVSDEVLNLIKPLNFPVYAPPSYYASINNTPVNAGVGLYPIFVGQDQFQNPETTTPCMASMVDMERQFNFPIPTAPSILLPTVETPAALAPVFVPPAEKTISTSAAAMYTPKAAVRKDAPVIEEKKKEKRQAVLA